MFWCYSKSSHTDCCMLSTVAGRKSCSGVNACWMSEWMFISCRGSLLSLTYYFPQAFWNNHQSANKTQIQIAAPLANITSALYVQYMQWCQHIVKLKKKTKIRPRYTCFVRLTLKLWAFFWSLADTIKDRLYLWHILYNPNSCLCIFEKLSFAYREYF